jgi:hypothetical protein
VAQFPIPQPGQKSQRPGPDLLKSIHTVRNRAAEALLARNSKLARAKQPVTKASVSINDIVAGLDFGFWTTMLDHWFDQLLWRTALYRAFPHYTAVTGNPLVRKPIASRFTDLRNLRNRIMHHEPLFKRNLQQDFQWIFEAVSWMYSDVESWISQGLSPFPKPRAIVGKVELSAFQRIPLA